MHTHTDTLSHTHTHTPADICFDSWVSHDTQGRNRRIQQVQYSMLERIQDFSIPRARWKTVCIFIHSGCVWSHKQKKKKALGTCCRSLQCNHVCLVLAFTVRALLFSFMQIFLHQCLRSRCLRVVVGADYIHSFAITSLYICNCSSIRAADIYLSGSGSSDLDEYIQSQETQAIPTLCSLLALDQ